MFQFVRVFRLSLHVVGNPCCLVLLWQISARRDKQCPLYRVRNICDTNHLQSFCKLYHHLEGIVPTSEHQKLIKNSENWVGKMRNNGENPPNCIISAYQRPLRACWYSSMLSRKWNWVEGWYIRLRGRGRGRRGGIWGGHICCIEWGQLFIFRLKKRGLVI